jgi:hypothetical protein
VTSTNSAAAGCRPRGARWTITAGLRWPGDGLADRPGDALGALDAARSTGFDRLEVDDKDHAELTRQLGPPASASPVARRAIQPLARRSRMDRR